MLRSVLSAATAAHLRQFRLILSCASGNSALHGTVATARNRQVIGATTSRGYRTSNRHLLEDRPGHGCLATSATLNLGKRLVDVEWSDGMRNRYPAVWLRDNCQCEGCFHPVSKARQTLLADLNPDIEPTSVKVDADGGLVTVTWPDGHVSPFPFDWLRARSFTPEGYRERTRSYPIKPVTWCSSDMQGNVSQVDFQQLLTDDGALYRWICGLEKTGIYLVTGAPREINQLRKIGDRVAFLRKTNYGPTFMVHAKLDPSNLAYTSGTLSLHTDLAYYNYQPGMQMLHCIAQVPTEGGENTFVDGFRAADILKAEYPEYFRLLTKYVIDFYDIGVDYYKFHKLTRQAIIRLNPFGETDRINYSQHGRDSFMNALPLEAIQPYYSALKTFDDILNDSANVINLKLNAGEIICLHNFRILHGRSSFKVIGGGERHLEGGYIDWDEMHSRKRVLLAELNETGSPHF